jgi:hypothetical protein
MLTIIPGNKAPSWLMVGWSWEEELGPIYVVREINIEVDPNVERGGSLTNDFEAGTQLKDTREVETCDGSFEQGDLPWVGSGLRTKVRGEMAARKTENWPCLLRWA